MGVDYIRAKSGKPWKRRWNAGLSRLKEPTLFDLNISESARTVMVELQPGVSVQPGEVLIAESGPTGVTVSKGLRSIGRLCNPSIQLTTAIAAGGGYAEATVQQVRLFGDTADVVIR